MSYLSQLTEEEVRYICKKIPLKKVIAYCRQHPRSFAKIMPGFRARAIAKYGSDRLLFKNRNNAFVASFIERHINEWLAHVEEDVEKCVANGDSEDLAFIRSLPHSFFDDNVSLYFKLLGEERPEPYLSLLEVTVKEIKEINEQQRTLAASLDGLRKELDLSASTQKELQEKLSEAANEIKVLKGTVRDLKKLNAVIRNKEAIISSQKAAIQALEEETRRLSAELAAARLSRQDFEAQVVLKEQEEKREQVEFATKPRAPKDVAEFKEYLAYNLEDIGVPTGEEYFPLLVDHLSHVLFQGIPIIINRSTGITLINCVANTLVGQKEVNRLTYEDSLSVQHVEEFLAEAGRIVCLDNFLGNFNETLLLPLFERHRNKIIFLTVAYDRTLNFVPREFLKYCFYLNLNRIHALTANSELTEDPSIIEEKDAVILVQSADSRYRSLFKEILSDFGINQALAEHKCAYVSSEQDLWRMLAFDALPFAIDVLQIAPYNVSERLTRYAGDAGRCPYKNIFRLWFT